MPLIENFLREHRRLRNRYLVFMTGSLFPGGGQFILREWDKGQGILTSVGLMVLIGSWSKVEDLVGNNRFLDNEGTSIPLYKNFVETLQNSLGKTVQTGEFGADMKVHLVNDGPVTFLLES